MSAECKSFPLWARSMTAHDAQSRPCAVIDRAYRGTKNRIKYLFWLSLILAVVTSSMAGLKHRGQVRIGALPIPGAVVRVTQGEKTLRAVTDADGSYAFPDLSDGPWTIQVEMSGFAPISAGFGCCPGHGTVGVGSEAVAARRHQGGSGARISVDVAGLEAIHEPAGVLHEAYGRAREGVSRRSASSGPDSIGPSRPASSCRSRAFRRTSSARRRGGPRLAAAAVVPL